VQRRVAYIPRRVGFTLIELLVVIAIIAILAAMIVPVFRGMMNGNRASACAAGMRAIGSALRMYYQDWQGAPPRYDASGGGRLDTDEDLSAYPSHVNTDDDYMVDGRGLMALVDGEYIKGTSMLHCPVHRSQADGNDPRKPNDPLSPTYAQSYTGRDNNPAHQARTDSSTDAYGLLNQYKYLSIRGVFDTADPDFRRQLCRCEDDGTGHAVPVFDPTWYPDDSTVVLWCNWHEDQIQKGGFGQYQVLYWDGSVRRMPAYLFHEVANQPAGMPVAAWRVRPSDNLQ
jgi:prepilin-type N-terminal cleavage/methylation domain-containing protein